MELYDTRSNTASSLKECAKLVISPVPEIMGMLRRDMRVRRPSDLTVPQFRTLIYLRRRPGSSISNVADHLGLALSTTSHLIDVVHRRGYVIRDVAKGDRRRATVSLTEQGQAMLKAVHAKARERMAKRLAVLSPDERQNLAAAMLSLMRVASEAQGNQE